MGLKDLFSRWTKSEDTQALERAERESRMTELDREADREDLEEREADIATESRWEGADASEVASDDLASE
jgi:hypothetical protein